MLLLDKMQLKEPPAKRRSVSIASDHTPFLRLQKRRKKEIDFPFKHFQCRFGRGK